VVAVRGASRMLTNADDRALDVWHGTGQGQVAAPDNRLGHAGHDRLRSLHRAATAG
jgi:hypothetical protein